MAEKNIKSRIVHKHDIESNWLLATNFAPRQGEIVVYDIDDNYDYERFKIGDGTTNVNDLPFADDALRAEFLEEINEVSALVGDTSVAEQIAEATENLATVARTGSWNDLIDKPFGEEISLVPFDYAALNNTVIIDTDGGWAVSKKDNAAATDPALGAILQGKALCIEWDGVLHEVSWNNSYSCMGNAYLYDDSYPDTGEPFCIAEYFTKTSWAEVYAAKAGTHTFATYESSTTIKTLDEKYIPDTIARVEDIPVIDNTLTQEGQAADAKAVGDAINEVSTLVGDTPVSDQINEALLNNQSDWNQSDETAADYIKNKTHWEETVENDFAGLEFANIETTNGYGGGVEITHNLNIPFALGQIWEVKSNNADLSYTGLEVQEAENGTLYIGTYPDADDTPFYITSNTIKGNGNWVGNTGTYSVTLTCTSGVTSETVIHKLDPKFIPWPDENDALELVAELGVVEPVVAADGSIYTDKNGVIYAL